MSVKQIVKEAMDRNPINMKEALQEELKARVAEAVEKRINEASKDFKKGDYVSHVDDEKVGKVTGVSGDKESVDVKWNDGETGSYDAEDLKVVKEDLDAELNEETKSIDDFMKLFKLKDEPEEGKRMNLGGYPFDYDGFEEDEVYLVAVDKDAAKGLAKEFKKRGFNSIAKSQEVTVMVDG